MENEIKKLGVALGLGMAVGTVVGAMLTKKSQELFNVRAPKVLNEVKERFDNTQEIEGSWIETKKEIINRHGMDQAIYKGGITCKDGDSFKQFEFIADAKTGAVIDIYPL